MNLAAVLRRGTLSLRAAGLDDAAIEAEVLLRHALGFSRAHLFGRFDDEIASDDEQHYLSLLDKRRRHFPTAYLTGHREFYGLDLLVGPGVLIPRPETEHLVEEALRVGRSLLLTHDRVTLVDVGVGSGAIALAVAKELPALRVLATDISPLALAQAELNAKRLRLAGRVTFLHGDLLEPVREQIDIIAANLPYIPTTVIPTLAPEVREHEPTTALDGGADGLALITKLIGQATPRLASGGTLLLEIGHDQAEALACICAEQAPIASLRFVLDLAGIRRIACLTM